MAAVGFCGLKPLLLRRKASILEGLKVIKGATTPRKSSKAQSKENVDSMELSFVGADQLILMVEIHKKIMAFRDIMDLAPCNSCASLREIVIRTLQDLQKFYPKIINKTKVSKIKNKHIDQAMAYFCEALKSLGESWMLENNCMSKLNIVFPTCKDNNMRQLGETMVVTLDNLMKLASERFDIEYEQRKEFSPIPSPSPRLGSFLKLAIGSGSTSFSESSFSFCSSPNTPRSVLPELMKYSSRTGESPRSSCASPRLWALRLQAVGKLSPDDVKNFSLNMSPTHIEKIDEEPKTEMEVDDNKPIKDTSEELVLDLDTNEDDHHDKTVKNDEAMEDVEQPLSPKQLQPQSPKPMPVSSSSPPPPPSAPSMILPNKITSPPSTPPPPQPPPMMQPNVAVPQPLAPPPPPPEPATMPAPPLPPTTAAVPAPPPPPTTAPPPPPTTAAVSAPAPPPTTAPPLPPTTAAVSAPPPPPTTAPPPPPTTAAVSAPPPPPTTAAVPAPPPPMKGGSVSAPPPPMPHGNGGAPPPPPPGGAGRTLRPKATTKLKRSIQLANLYRTLKGKVEGSSLNGKSAAAGRKSAVAGASNGGKQGMADALAEMTKRSSYFIQIEEDVQKYTKQILELRPKITNFKTNNMTELSNFQKDVESILEKLTDESQVLSRFEGFPTKKLEAVRMAAALYKKLDLILTELQNWKVVTPIGHFLDNVERYFNKIKTELDAIERTKDDESKKFKSHNIEFDFHILIKIKEAMVDVSSTCMELVLKEKRESNGPKKECAKLLWRAFQFVFRVYTFAGGHDERADKLTRELAKEIESGPIHP
ncbi:unnamed protein product [Lathyrus oleraceus]